LKGHAVSEQLEKTTLAKLTAEIASAYVSKNHVPVNDIGSLISSIADKLRQIGQEPKDEGPAKLEPVVSVRRSVQRDHLVCLICGKQQKMLKGHLARHHGMTPADYREAFDLQPDYPMVAPDYSEQRSATAKKTGLGRKPVTPEPAQEKPKLAGKRKNVA
jgi:predicted transcriptional regulator